MSAQDNEVNGNIDTETTEGQVVRRGIEEKLENGKRAVVRPSDGIDDEAEGPTLASLSDSGLATGHRQTGRCPAGARLRPSPVRSRPPAPARSWPAKA